MRVAPAALTLVVTATIAAMFIQWLKQNSLFFPERYPGGYWELGPRAGAREAFFETSDGVRLHSWYFGATNPAAPLLIWFHGNGGNLTYRAPVAAELARRGVSVFLFDWRGYGRSEGSPTERGLFRDSMAAYDFAARTYGPQRPIVLYGESLGGPYAAYVARKRPSCAVVVENSFSSLSDIANAVYSPLPLGLVVSRSLRTADWIREAKVPLLVMHGRRDRIIPFALGKRIYDAAAEPKELFISERADHSGIPDAEGDRYYDVVLSFLTKHCSR